jgi:hypothetical protein
MEGYWFLYVLWRINDVCMFYGGFCTFYGGLLISVCSIEDYWCLYGLWRVTDLCMFYGGLLISVCSVEDYWSLYVLWRITDFCMFYRGLLISVCSIEDYWCLYVLWRITDFCMFYGGFIEQNVIVKKDRTSCVVTTDVFITKLQQGYFTTLYVRHWAYFYARNFQEKKAVVIWGMWMLFERPCGLA